MASVAKKFKPVRSESALHNKQEHSLRVVKLLRSPRFQERWALRVLGRLRPPRRCLHRGLPQIMPKMQLRPDPHLLGRNRWVGDCKRTTTADRTLGPSSRTPYSWTSTRTRFGRCPPRSSRSQKLPPGCRFHPARRLAGQRLFPRMLRMEISVFRQDQGWKSRPPSTIRTSYSSSR